ncbi:hypothetical protein P170DRAFT_468996 [Aspergillus steynii IBT 23096]|uniref:Uncharacterized protein n=1 Tax=Aspergillus steynii IBT 23096 TaxID=1392250 RepID=A0A2I2FRW8_9EURO|nr:uncharacterized protein P170DRAFT_468996 [Aspergillus steynii IBT 23096]PLB43374.1 hypothetical protein P170DRAFT_468996 [Aspergillus steynii IBT 23096]
MSATIHCKTLDLDEIIPRPNCIEREDEDVKRLVPLVFHDACFATDRTDSWPDDQAEFRNFFAVFFSFYDELREPSETSPSIVFKEREMITLPRKNWTAPSRGHRSAGFRGVQVSLMTTLMQTICYNLDGIQEQLPGVWFTYSPVKMRYFIGGKRYASTSDGGAVVGPFANPRPIIPHVSWYRGQSWSEFLADVMDIMLGKLASNLTFNSEGQEAFIVGIRGPCIYVIRGRFTASLVSRVHSKGCAENESFELQFTRGFNLRLKEDWLQATRALARLLRYIPGGKAVEHAS